MSKGELIFDSGIAPRHQRIETRRKCALRGEQARLSERPAASPNRPEPGVSGPVSLCQSESWPRGD
jgi:hypothetical protein